MPDFLNRRRILTCIAVLLGIRLLMAYLLPMTKDESYYVVWGQHLDWGYLDHPPMVAWLASLGHHLKSAWGPLAYRLPGILLNFVGAYFFWRLSGLITSSSKTRILALWMLFGAAATFMANILLTPDAAAFAFWIVSLHEAARGIRGEEKRWLTAGAAAGLAMMGKYTSILLPLVFILALWTSKREQLKTRWPYLGFAAFLLVLSPHVMWNAQNNWTTFRFLLGRGLHSTYEIFTDSQSDLPLATKPLRGGPEYQIAAALVDPAYEAEPRPKRSPAQKFKRRMERFFSGQTALWGVTVFPIGLLFLRRRRHWRELIPWRGHSSIDGLLRMAVFVPLGFFGFISLFANVEANWPSAYIVGASLLLASPLTGMFQAIRWTSIINGLVLLAVTALPAVHGFVQLPESIQKNRILQETTGYEELTAMVKKLDKPVCAETYQLASMLDYYGVSTVCQWSNIARPSEWLRRSSLNRVTAQQVQDGFHLVHEVRVPPSIAGYRPLAINEIRDCADGTIYATNSQYIAQYENPCTEKTIHKWFVTEYERLH